MGKGLRDPDDEHTASPPMSDKRRRIVGNYELGAILAIGDFDCYTQLCTYIPTGVSYVARIYNKTLLAETHWMWERVRESVHVQRTLPEHPNIIEMIECFETMTSLYIVMSMFSSVSIVKLFVGHHIPTACGSSPTDGTRAPSVERKHSHSADATLKGANSNTGVGFFRGARKDLRRDSDSRVYNCYNDSESDAKGNVRNCFAPALRGSPLTGGGAAGKEVMPIIISQERDTVVGQGDAQVHPGLPVLLHSRGSQSKLRKTSLSLNSVVASFEPPLPPPSASVSGTIEIGLVWHVFMEVVHGVLHLHRHGVVHGGIAPDHVLYNPDRGWVRISNLVSCSRCRRGTKRTELRGTRHTVAPEVLKQEPYDPYLADAWSLGVLLYFMLNGGRYPHDGANTLKHILYHKIRPMKTTQLPASAVDLVMHLLQPNPAERLTVEAILYHPFCAQGSPLATVGSQVGRADDDDANASRKDMWSDSFFSLKNFESSAHSFAGFFNSGARPQSGRANSSRKSSHRSLQIRRQLTQSSSSLVLGGGESLGGTRNPATTLNRVPRSLSPQGRLASLPFLFSLDVASPQQLPKRTDRRRLYVDDWVEDEAAAIIQRAYRIYRWRKHFRWVTQTLLKKSSTTGPRLSISRSEGHGGIGGRSLSARCRYRKPWSVPRLSHVVQAGDAAEEDVLGESYPKDAAGGGGGSPSVGVSPCKQESAARGDDEADEIVNLPSNQIVQPLDGEAIEVGQLCRSNFNPSKIRESHQISPSARNTPGSWFNIERRELSPQENKLPPILPNLAASSFSKASGCRSPHTLSHSHGKLHSIISPIHSKAVTTAVKLPEKFFRGNGGDLHPVSYHTQRPSRQTVSKPYVDTKYEYKNGVFLLTKTM